MTTHNLKASGRQVAHKKMKSWMEVGLLQEALRESRQALAVFGPHVGLLCDQAACEYELGFFQACGETCKEIEKNFLEAETLLSKTSARKTLLVMAKFQEEKGEVTLALSSLKKAAGFVEEENQLKYIQSQELRILSFLNEKAELNKKYLLLTENTSDLNLAIEVMHGLLWAEWSLFGYNHAAKRWEEFKSFPLNPLDLRLIARDFLEICLLDENSEKTLELEAQKILSLGPVLPYDEFLLGLSKNRNDFIEMPFGLSFMMKIRVLLFQIRSSQNFSQKIELRKKFNFLLEGLQESSAGYLRNLLPVVVEPNPMQIEILLSQKSFRFRGKSTPLTTQQTDLMKLLSQHQSLSLEDAVNVLWSETCGEHHYHRMRMLVYKLNRLVQLELGLAAIEIKKSGLVLNSSIEIKIAS